MGDRCTGKCCREFAMVGLGGTPDEIHEILRARHEDGYIIADMLVPTREVQPGDLLPTGQTAVERAWLFTCRHFTGVDCGIYATRPRMCRDYPYREPCEYGKHCTWDKARAGLHPKVLPTYHELLPDAVAPPCKRRTHLVMVSTGDQTHV